METVACLGALLLAGLVGRELLRRLGWPTRIETAGRWAALLLALGLAFGFLRTLVHPQSIRYDQQQPSLDSAEIVAALVLVAVAVIGYVSWRRREPLREAARRRAERARALPRRRALPPPPDGIGAPPGVFGHAAPDDPPEQ